MAFMEKEKVGGKRISLNGISTSLKKRRENPARIEPADFMKFKAIEEADYYPESEFCEEIIAPRFHLVFDDFIGTITELNTYTGELSLVFYFKYIPESEKQKSGNGKLSALYSIVDAVQTNPNDTKSKIISINQFGRRTQRAFMLTDEAEDIFADFIPVNNKEYLPDYYNEQYPLVFEQTVNNNIGSDIIVGIRNVNINMVLSKVLYPKNENGDHFQYRMGISRAMEDGDKVFENMDKYGRKEFLLKLERVNKTKLDKLSAKLGYVKTNYGIRMFTGK